MPKQVQYWECSFCGTLYKKENEAQTCEDMHARFDNLEIENATSFWKDSRFPEKIVVGIKNYSGVAAEYKLITHGSVEDIYERHPWNSEGD